MIFGSEHELVIADRSPASALWVPNSTELPLRRSEPQVLGRLLSIAADVFGTDVTFTGRVHLNSAAVIYIDGDSLEYTTPPCSSPMEVAMHECDLAPILTVLQDEYEERFDHEVQIDLAGEGPDGHRSGYHENYGLTWDQYFALFHRNHFPKPVWRRSIVPFLVTRILMVGAGGVDDLGSFRVSPRASLTTHVFHGSSDPQRPLVHLRRPDPRSAFPRLQFTCADPNDMVYPIVMRFTTTACVLTAAAAGALDDIDFTLRDPVASIHELSRNPRADMTLADGSSVPAVDVFGRISEAAIPACKPDQLGVDRSILDAWLAK